MTRAEEIVKIRTMREIKFRGRAAQGEWLCGDLEYRRAAGVAIIHTYNEDGTYNRQEEVNPDTVGQFTGLYDKNGKEIYEGDIVHLDAWSPYYMQICFIEGAFCLADKNGWFLGDIHYIHHAEVEQCSVVGNIHDNPELLKGCEK